MWMPTTTDAWPGTKTLEEADRQAGELAALCDLPSDTSVWDCGRTWCSYFDDDRDRCALLIWNVPNRLGPVALKWFAEHRTMKPVNAADLEFALAARTASL